MIMKLRNGWQNRQQGSLFFTSEVVVMLLLMTCLSFPVVYGQPITTIDTTTTNYYNNNKNNRGVSQTQQRLGLLEDPRELVTATTTGRGRDMMKKAKSGSSTRRSGIVQDFQILDLGFDGIQSCETTVMIQLFDDLPMLYFRDPNCIAANNDDGRIPSSNDDPNNNDNEDFIVFDDPDNIFVHDDDDDPLLQPNRRQHGCFIGKDGSMTLTMRQEDDGIIAASINDYENNILYSITGDMNIQGELFVRENPLENMMEEADIDELLLLSTVAASTTVGRKGGGVGSDRRNLEYPEETSSNKMESEVVSPMIQPPSQTPTALAVAPAPAPPTRTHFYTSKQRQKSKKKHIRGTTSYVRGSRRNLSGNAHQNLDIMVVWTKMAECELSNMDPDFPNDDCRRVDDNTLKKMVAHVKLAIDETNEAFVGSGIPASLRLVHYYRHSKYKESNDGSRSLDAILDITHGRTDLDDVHELRDEYGADLVAFIINADDYCGVAWRNDPPVADEMFSVSHWDCSTGYYSFGHEIGHNFGCHHNRGSVRRCDEEDYPGYNYGYRDPDGDFRSILAYNCDEDECDTNKNGCMRVPRFSNPDLPYGDDDKPIGSEFSNCARQFTDHLPTVSGFAASILDADTEEPSSRPSISSRPSDTPTSTPSNTPSSLPSLTPTDNPSSSPSELPTGNPSISGNPSSTPISVPSYTPSDTPSAAPQIPSSEPSGIPSTSVRPSRLPSATPSSSSIPSATPSSAPQFPSSDPTSSPSVSDRPSRLPSTTPTSSAAPSTKPTAAPSSSVFPSSQPSQFPSGHPTIFPSSAPSSKDCTGKVENLCGYVESKSSSGESILVPGAYSACVYKTDKMDDPKSECLLERELSGVDIDSPLNGNDKLSLSSCGCCEGDEDKDICSNDATCIDDVNYVCDEKDGLVKTKYCYFDEKKSENKEKCNDPFKDLKGDVIQCGNCD